MNDTPHHRARTVVCLASFFKGVEFIRECKRQGFRVVLLTKEKCKDEAWPHDCVDEFVTVPNEAATDYFVFAVTRLARTHRITQVVALEEFDVLTAALIREHLCLPGLTSSRARRFRDKLAMRVAARAAGIAVPDYTGVFNYEELDHFMRRTSAPWVLKPRTDVSAIGIRKLHDAEEVWRAMDELDARARFHEQSSAFLLERFVHGGVYHVDSLVNDGQVIFAGASAYGRPPLDVAHDGGIFISHGVERETDEHRQLLALNQQVIEALGLARGAAHAEFIRGADDNQLYFLEIAARVGGAYLAETLEAASGINLWREWARLELLDDEQPYALPATRDDYAGIALTLARQEQPDTSAYTDPEIAYRVTKSYHAGLVVCSNDPARVRELLHNYARRFNTDFSATAPPLEHAE